MKHHEAWHTRVGAVKLTLGLMLIQAPITGFTQQNNDKMTIEIWSDVACPFCYIGQAHLLEALADFPEKEYITIEWKSFILDHGLPESTDLDLYHSLSQRKGIPMAQVMQMTARVEQMARAAGLQVNFDKAQPVNTLKAHLLIQLAKQEGKADAMENRLFEAYFREGAKVSDMATLERLGVAVGLDADAIQGAMQSEGMRARVAEDIGQAKALGINGVPYFLVDGKYGFSGAQPVHALKTAIAEAYQSWAESNTDPKAVRHTQGPGCDPVQKCD